MADCIRCSADRHLNRFPVYSFGPSGIQGDWGLEFFCPQCTDRLVLRCKGHETLMTCAYDPSQRRDIDSVPSLFTTCRHCVYASVRTLPSLRKAKLLAFAVRSGLSQRFLQTLEHAAPDIIPSLDEDERIVYGFLMHASLAGHTATEYMQSHAKAQR
jgi:hypothetical protein